MRYTLVLLLICYLSTSSFASFSFNLRDESTITTKSKAFEYLELQSKSIWPEKNEHGFIPIGNDGSDMFYWHFPARENPETAPLVLWLTGGPGCSSELAIFYENGPFKLTQESSDTTLIHNKYSWNTRANMIYIDSPIGTGFSKAAHEWDLNIFERQVAKNITELLVKFIQKHPEFTKRDFYITGESYAGKYIPFLGKYLDDMKNDENVKKYINLKGVAIGNGFVYPINQYDSYVSFPYNNGLINDAQKQEIQVAMEKCKKISEAGILFADSTVCENAMAIINKYVDRFNVYDIRKKCVGQGLCYNFDSITELFKKPEVIADLGIQDRLPYEMCSDGPNTALIVDYNTDASIGVAQLLNNNYKVYVYSGDKDYSCNWEGGLSWVTKMSWKHQNEFNKIELTKCDYGSCKEFANLKFIKVADSGHMVPMDQPENALKMLDEILGF